MFCATTRISWTPPRKEIEDLKAAVDLVALFQAFGVEVRKQGWGCKALCPFRDDKTPSLSIDPKKGLYKWFGCGKAGDSLTFLQEHAKLSFSEAVAELRRHAGIQPAQAQPVPNTKEKEVPIYGAQGMPRDFGDMLLVAGVREISSCLDADKAGRGHPAVFSVLVGSVASVATLSNWPTRNQLPALS